ncbi:hypothetical protein K490DRAFT_62923 [Saccharata proteae CBS 121410]|uniref:Tim17-domain-containing protein n=1 Tax=Saccharata proteae CBS 121410 TaxID=1314787 RepID=A0A9P4HVS7_9PEZI|nr:hypothetical protein K490DRAFT_62923 [Saccharata proteae CBS 121410]
MEDSKLSPDPVDVPPRQSYRSRHSHDRLSMGLQTRTTLAAIIASATGFGLGLSQGGTMAGLRYRAENAHRLPTDEKGWYFYHKSKNYHVLRGGVKEGFRMGPKVGFWAAGFFIGEEAVDRLRGVGGRGSGRGDAMSTVVAGLGTAGAWSLWNRFPLITAARTAKTGLVVGLGYGLLQDVLTILKGQKISYIEFVRSLPARWEERQARLEEKKQKKIAEYIERRRKQDAQT